jgi:5-methylcytosine-specific restriction endonuclease McrA
MKVCRRCNETKLLDEFDRNPRGIQGRDACCKVCKRARVVERMIARQEAEARGDFVPPTSKKCCRCGEEKPVEQFKRNRSAADGYHPECKVCCKAARDANQDAILDYARRYYADHAEERRAYARKYRETNPEKAAESQAKFRKSPKRRDWRNANRPKLRAVVNAWLEKHPGYMTRYARHWQAERRRTHPEEDVARRHARKARRLGNGGRFTAMEWRLLKARYRYTCLCCGQREPAIKLTPDHVIPLAKGGSNGIENIQPLCGSCNYRKHTKTTDYRPAKLSA